MATRIGILVSVMVAYVIVCLMVPGFEVLFLVFLALGAIAGAMWMSAARREIIREKKAIEHQKLAAYSRGFQTGVEKLQEEVRLGLDQIVRSN